MPEMPWPVFVSFTLLLMGWIAFMTGQTLAATWRPWGQVVPYTVLLGGVDRFFVYALFEGQVLSVEGFLIDTLWLMSVGLVAHRRALARKMSLQYPWLYVREGWLGWRDRAPEDS